MRKTRVVIYLDEEQREGLGWHSKWTSVSEIGRRAIKEFLTRRSRDRNRDYNPNNPPGRKPHWMNQK